MLLNTTTDYKMKKIALIAGIAFSIASCGHNAEKEAQQRTIDSMQNEIAKQQVIDSMNQAMAEAEAIRQDSIMSAKQQAVVSTGSSRRSGGGSSRSGGGGTTYNSTTNNYNTTPNTVASQPPANATPAQKKRWSSKATGALIGAGAGALGGALISDKKGKGAIIGGLGGAAVGLGTGAIIDAERKKKEQQQQQQQQ